MAAQARSNPKVWFTIGLVTALAGALAFLNWRGHSTLVRRESTPAIVDPRSSAALDALPAETKAARKSATLNVPDPVAAALEPAVHDRVIDDHFEVPVFARIEPDIGAAVFSDAQTGRFRLSDESAGWTKVHAFAEGFEDAIVEALDVQGISVGEIRLRGARSGSVIVQFVGGTPAMGVSVAWRAAVEISYAQDPAGWIDSRAQQRGEVVTKKTDLEGIARLTLGSPAIAVIEDPRNRATKTVKVGPGEDVLVVLPESVLSLCFVDDKIREPIQDLELDAWCPREISAMSETLSTDAGGCVTVAPTSFPVWIRRHGASAYQSELIPLSDGMSRCGIAGDNLSMIRVDAPRAEMILIGVRASGARVRLVDAETGTPIDALVRVCTRSKAAGDGGTGSYSKSSVWSPHCGYWFGELYRLRNGLLELPIFFGKPEELVRGANDSTLLVLTAAGYHPYRVRETSDVTSDVDGTPLIKLKPGVARRIRLVRPDGSPYAGNMYVFSADEDVMCYSSTGLKSGIYGPFDWLGGSLELGIRAGQGRKWTVSAADLAANDIVTITLPIQAGSITVENIPEDYSRILLMASSENSGELWPNATGPGRCHFNSIPAGSYIVGPREWVRGAEMQTLDATEDGMNPAGNTSLRVRVNPGETAIVHWREVWGAGREIEGHVRVISPVRIEPFLVPLYGSEGSEADDDPSKAPRMIFGRRAPRIPLDRDGNYSIGPTAPLPRLIAICVTDETVWGSVQGLHVLEVIKPGESAEIATGSVELVWKGTPDPRTTIRYELPVETLRHALSTFYRYSETRWPMTDRALRIDGIPLHVKELVITQRWIQPIELDPGKLVRIEVDVTQLAVRSRPRR